MKTSKKKNKIQKSKIYSQITIFIFLTFLTNSFFSFVFFFVFSFVLFLCSPNKEKKEKKNSIKCFFLIKFALKQTNIKKSLFYLDKKKGEFSHGNWERNVLTEFFFFCLYMYCLSCFFVFLTYVKSFAKCKSNQSSDSATKNKKKIKYELFILFIIF